MGWGQAPERVTVLPNPAPDVPDLPAYTPPGVPRLAFAGRINRQKALEVALRALAQVEGVELVLAGDGPERGQLEEEARRLGLDGRVRFAGALGRREVLELFRAADASILTSAWENFPHTVVEALAVGTPVIATAVGGIPEIVLDGENGLLVPAHDVDALVAAIERVLRDDGLRAALAAAAAPSVAELSEQRILSRIVEEIEQGSP